MPKTASATNDACRKSSRPSTRPLLKAISILLPVNDGGSVRLAVYAGGQLDGGPHAGSPAQLLFDFGQTTIGPDGDLTIESDHIEPTGDQKYDNILTLNSGERWIKFSGLPTICNALEPRR